MKMKSWKVYVTVLLFSAAGFNFDGCAKNPATGERNFNLVSQSQEIQMGKEADQQIVATMGLYEDQNVQNYVDKLGKEMAAKSERPDLPWTFRVIDDPIVNAFALPGGFIYVTRGIMTHLNSESELTGVLGHEIGHVTAKHSVNRISKLQLTQLGLGIATILKPELQQYSQFAELGLGLLFLKFSRDDEREADELGLRYMVKVNDDPSQMAEVMKTLQRVSQSSGGEGGGIPQWLSTHPDPQNRIELINSKVKEMGSPAGGQNTNREEYLRKLENMAFGDNPREGYFQGNTFYHPELKFSFNFPQGWKTINQKQAVIGISPAEDALIQISLSDKNSPDQAAGAFFGQQGITGSNPQQVNINGFSSVRGNFTAQSEQGGLAGDAAFISYEGKVYQVLSYSGQQSWSKYQSAVGSAVNSFNRVTDPNVLNVQPNKIKIVTIDSDMTLDEFNRKYPSAVPVETVALINKIEKGGKFTKGQLAKQVVK